MQFLGSIDSSLFLVLNDAFENEAITWLMLQFSSGKLFIALIILWFLTVMFLRWWGWFRHTLLALCAMGASDVLCAYLFKPTFLRLRPCHTILEAVVLAASCGGQYGMPSSHASNAAAFAFVMAVKMDKTLTFVVACLAFLVGFSRIYLGVHYPLDVTIGFLIGSLIGFSFSLPRVSTAP